MYENNQRQKVTFIMYIAFYYKNIETTVDLYLKISDLNSVECIDIYPHRLIISKIINIYRDGKRFVTESNNDNTITIEDETSIRKLIPLLEISANLFICFSSNINLHTAVNIIEHISILLREHNLQTIYK
jgi:hypothetical protein